MVKLFGCPINLEAEEEDGGGGISIDVELSRSGNQPYGEATSFSSAGLPPFDQREETVLYFRFLDSNSDSGSVSMESEPDLHRCFIDFFDRESYVASNQRLSTSYDFDIWGVQDMEEEIELGLRIGSGSGSDHSGWLGLQVAEFDSSRVGTEAGRVGVEAGRVEIDTGRVGVDTGRVEVDTGRVEVDTGRVEVGTGLSLVEVEAMVVDEAQNATTRVSEPVEAILHYQEDEPMEPEWLGFYDVFFDDSFDISEPPLGVLSMDEYADENHEDYEDVIARTFDESGISGSPPASKSVVDELPDVEITSEELSVGCAICKDEIAVEEKVKRLPCRHYYHEECIVPWLGIRNTCPVCRYELPTDDQEYERYRRSQRGFWPEGLDF